MKKIWSLFVGVVILTVTLIIALTQITYASATLSANEYKAGDTVTIQGSIAADQDLFIAIASQSTFAPKDTTGVHEAKRLKKEQEKRGFGRDTPIPALYYMLTNVPERFGNKSEKRFGGPSFIKGIYKTTMFRLSKFQQIDAEATGMLGPIRTEQEWNFFKFAHESVFGINTITKEKSLKGKVVIFARSVIGDYETTGNYWDKGTSIYLDKKTGNFKACFKTFRHTPPDTKFDVYVNGTRIGSYTLRAKGFWMKMGCRYMNPIWIIIWAIIIGAYFSMIGAAGGMLMAAFQVMIVQTTGPLGINAANVIRPSNVALTLFSPLGSFYRYAIVERRVAWPAGISFGVGILIGAIWLGKYATQYLPLKTYKEWLAILVLLMGIRTLYELTPKVMEKRKSIKAMVKKFNDEVIRAKTEGRSAEMGRIEPVKTGLTDYQFKFWDVDFSINPLVFGLLGIGIGVVSRSFGIGGGFLLVPAMTTLGALPMYVAVPISLIGTSLSSLGSFLGYLINGYMPDLWIAFAIIIGGFVGGVLGSRLQKFFSEIALKWALAITLFLLFFHFLKIEIWI